MSDDIQESIKEDYEDDVFERDEGDEFNQQTS
jgi:hypothetical protein